MTTSKKGADIDIPKVFLKTRAGSALQLDGERAVNQCAVVLHATIPKYIVAEWKGLPTTHHQEEEGTEPTRPPPVPEERSQASPPLPSSSSSFMETTRIGREGGGREIEGEGGNEKRQLQHGHESFVAMIVSGSTAGAVYFLDPDNEPNKGNVYVFIYTYGVKM
jgi:hypothetical protein